MNFTVFDIETDGLIETVTKIHCLSYNILTERGVSLYKGTLTDYEAIKSFITKQDIIVGHNIIRYDIPVLKKILGIDLPYKLNQIVDTLGLSWYLFPTEEKNGTVVKRMEHGLEHWGDVLGIEKPPISDWSNLSVEEYTFRCESDVNINTRLWLLQKAYLHRIYGEVGISRIIGYLSFKLDCAKEQEEVYCKIDKTSCVENLTKIKNLIDIRTKELSSNMPINKKFGVRKRPALLTKIDGTVSVIGQKWIDLCKERNIDDPKSVVELPILLSEEPGNPASSKQVKDWLFNLGWIPTMFKDSKNKLGQVKEVPQIANKDGEICPNIKKMFEKYPFLEALEGLSILNHRRGVFESFMEAMDSQDRIQAKIDGFTNTLRFQHRKPVANLPKVTKPWGEEIRGLIIKPDDNHILCGSDMSALEDTTKQHYMYFYDPEYVQQMRIPGFDPHLDIALIAEMMSQEEIDFYKANKNNHEDATIITEIVKLGEIRGNAKVVNFAGIYGASPAKIAKTLGCTIEFATKLHTAYWQRNKAVKEVVKHVIHKTVYNQMWLFNPVSQFWYSLRFEKDIFSTLNQGTGVYCFDTQLRNIRKKGIKIMLQYHDEEGFSLLKEDKEKVEGILKEAIKETNEEIKLNVPLDVSIDFGDNYAQIH